ncbi:MAG: HEAT repeat domain-containing protein, partial [Planctomycetes bacterium]|nr:HEAT repeat domain-containing protein [Planctomycetota bacterium]
MTLLVFSICVIAHGDLGLDFNRDDEKKFHRLIQNLSDTDPIKRFDAASALVSEWRNKNILNLVEHEVKFNSTNHNHDTLARLKNIYEKMLFRVELGKSLVDALGEKVDEIILWDVSKLVNSIRDVNKPLISGLYEEKQRLVYIEWIYNRLKNRDDKILLQDIIAGQVYGDSITYTPFVVSKKDAVNVIIRFLNDNDHRVRIHALGIFKVMKAVEAATKISELLNDDHLEIRSLTIETLASLDAQEYKKEIAKHLSDPSNYVRYTAIQALSTLRAEEYVGDIAEFLSDTFKVSSEANPCREFASSENQYSDKNRFIWPALDFLKKFHAKEYIPIIEKLLLSDLDPPGKLEVLEALLDLDPKKEYIDQVVRFIKEGNTFAIKILGKYKVREHIDLVVKCLNDRDSVVRSEAVNALANFNDPKLASHIARLLLDPSCVIEAIAALKQLDRTDEAKKYYNLIQQKYFLSNDTFLKWKGLLIAEGFGAREFTEDIVRFLGDTSEFGGFACSLTSCQKIENSITGKAKALLIDWQITPYLLKEHLQRVVKGVENNEILLRLKQNLLRTECIVELIKRFDYFVANV